MLEVLPVQDKEAQERYAKACGVPFRAGSFAYSMTESQTGEFLGMSQFDLEGGWGVLQELVPAADAARDFEAMFILGRATMNFIDLCGCHRCRALPDAGEDTLLRAIGFSRTENGEWQADMTGMFDGNCGGKKAPCKP